MKNYGSVLDMLLGRKNQYEDMQKRKAEVRKEREEQGFIYPNEKYVGTSRVSQEDVEKNPEEFVIAECLDACKILWGKNIYTYMCSEYGDIGQTWIEFIEENLSEENLNILKNLPKDKFFTYYGYHIGTIMVGVKKNGYQAKNEMQEIAGMLKLQDVPEKEACISLEDALISIGYYKEVPNPNYTPIEEFASSWEEMERIFKSGNNEKTIKVLDTTNIKAPIPELLSYSGFIFDEESQKIYRSNFHYMKHMNYYYKLRQKEALANLNIQ